MRPILSRQTWTQTNQKSPRQLKQQPKKTPHNQSRTTTNQVPKSADANARCQPNKPQPFRQHPNQSNGKQKSKHQPQKFQSWSTTAQILFQPATAMTNTRPRSR